MVARRQADIAARMEAAQLDAARQQDVLNLD
jgi:hypothetical protein